MTFGTRAYRRSVYNLEAHLAGGAGDDAEGGFIASRIQVLRLCLNDIHDLFARYLADLCLVRFFGTSGDVRRFLNKTAAGGLLVMKVNDLSLKTVMTTGRMSPACFWVAALNSLQKAMMLTPRGPSAVPTGGAGLAWPAGICSLI